MSEQNTPSQTQDTSTLWVITHRVGSAWRCLFANVEPNQPPSLVETIEVQGDTELSTLLDSKCPANIFCILSGSLTICRTTTLPDIEKEQIHEALRLQAEAKFLGGIPNHRRAMAPLDVSIGETNRVGLIVAWPERSSLDVPSCLHNASFIPDAASIAALLDGFRPTEPLIFADSTDGTVTLALSHANGAALRATHIDYSSPETFVEGILQTTRETATHHNHTESFTQGMIAQMQSTLQNLSSETPLVLLPDVVIEGSAKRFLQTSQTDQAWWRTWGIAAGGLLAASGSLHALTTMKFEAPELHPSVADRWSKRLSNRTVATKLVVAAILLIAFGPTLTVGAKLGIMHYLNPDLEQQYKQVVEARKQQIVYKELSKSAWPMTKIIADITNNTPVGIDIESIRISVGDPVSIRGRALGADGYTAAELIASMQQKLQATGMFKDIQFSYDPAGTYGDRDFDLWVTIIDPLRRPKYEVEQDFGLWTYAMRQDGTPYEGATKETTDSTNDTLQNHSEDTTSTTLDEENTESGVEPTETDDNTEHRTRANRPSPSGGAGTKSHSEVRVSGGTTSRIPEPLSPEQIAVMTKIEANVALTEVAKGLKHIGSDKEGKERLKVEMALLLERLKELRK